MELRREVRFYLSFTDKEVFRGGGPPPKKKKAVPWPLPLPTSLLPPDIPSAADVPETQPVLKPMLEKKAPQYARWEKVLHASQLVLATGEIPQPPMMPKWRGRA